MNQNTSYYIPSVPIQLPKKNVDLNIHLPKMNSGRNTCVLPGNEADDSSLAFSPPNYFMTHLSQRLEYINILQKDKC